MEIMMGGKIITMKIKKLINRIKISKQYKTYIRKMANGNGSNVTANTILIVVIVIIVILLIIFFVWAAFASTEDNNQNDNQNNTIRCNLLPRDHTVISCTKPLSFGLKVISSHRKLVIFKVYEGNSQNLLWTSGEFKIDSVTKDVFLTTNIQKPPPLFRIEMCLAESGNLLSRLLLETQCEGSVNEVKILNPPLKGCTMIVSTPFDQERPMNAPGSTGWPTAIVAVPRCFIGKFIKVDYVDNQFVPGEVIGSGQKIIDQEIVYVDIIAPFPIFPPGNGPEIKVNVYIDNDLVTSEGAMAFCRVYDTQDLEGPPIAPNPFGGKVSSKGWKDRKNISVPVLQKTEHILEPFLKPKVAPKYVPIQKKRTIPSQHDQLYNLAKRNAKDRTNLSRKDPQRISK